MADFSSGISRPLDVGDIKLPSDVGFLLLLLRSKAPMLDLSV